VASVKTRGSNNAVKRMVIFPNCSTENHYIALGAKVIREPLILVEKLLS